MSFKIVRLDRVCEINPRSPKSLADDEVVSFLPMAAVSEDGFILFEEDREARAVKKGFTVFERGDVLVAKITPCFENGKAARTDALANPVGFGSTEFHVIRAGDEIDSSYLFHLIWNARLRETGKMNMTGSAGQKRVPADFLKRLEIPLPPLPEQRRIAAILDKADALRRKRKRAIDLLDGLTQSIFLEMFGDPIGNPKGFKRGRIGDLLIETQYGTSAKAGGHGAYPILRMGNITTDGKIETEDLKYIDLNARELEKYTVRRGDILFNRTNSADLVGKTAVFDLDEPYAFAGYLVRARTKKGISPYYISAYLNSRHGKATLRGMAKSIVGMANINAKEMASIPILVPDGESQHRYATALEAFGLRQRIFHEQLGLADALFSALQHRALSSGL
ncbi:restriction endonuclease subunit S [Mesorhizobium yinganensis]|uniref:restriction endonuclease subunit S n=1 Tax=Mesorhizobium yinganensis TaxID=3157707 RepID=UPI0032B82853